MSKHSHPDIYDVDFTIISINPVVFLVKNFLIPLYTSANSTSKPYNHFFVFLNWFREILAALCLTFIKFTLTYEFSYHSIQSCLG